MWRVIKTIPRPQEFYRAATAFWNPWIHHCNAWPDICNYNFVWTFYTRHNDLWIPTGRRGFLGVDKKCFKLLEVTPPHNPEKKTLQLYSRCSTINAPLNSTDRRLCIHSMLHDDISEWVGRKTAENQSINQLLAISVIYDAQSQPLWYDWLRQFVISRSFSLNKLVAILSYYERQNEHILVYPKMM